MNEKRGGWFPDFLRASMAARERRQTYSGEGFADQLVFDMGQGGGILPEEQPQMPTAPAPQAEELPEKLYTEFYQDLLGKGASPSWAERRAYELMARLYRGG